MTLSQFCHRPEREVRRFIGRRHEPQGCVRSDLVKVRPPRLDLAPGVVQRQEPVRVKAFVAQSAIEAFNEGIVGRLSGPAEVQRDAVDIGPMVERPIDKFRAIVHTDICGGAATTATTCSPLIP